MVKVSSMWQFQLALVGHVWNENFGFYLVHFFSSWIFQRPLDSSSVFTTCKHWKKECFFPPIGRGWRPRSSWKLPSSHPGCRAIRALKEPSECLKGAEEGWEFLSHWELLEDINFYYHFAQPSLFLSHALVYPLQLDGALFNICIPALEM